MKEVKVEKVLSGFNTVELKRNNRPSRFIPMKVEDEHKVYQRAQIIKNFNVFKNEKFNNYTQKYMSTLYGLLFKNERKYYLKRNKLNINIHEMPEEEDIVVKLPLTQPNKAIKAHQLSTPFLEANEAGKANQSSTFLNQKSFPIATFTPGNRNSNKVIVKKEQRRFHNLSVEKSRLLEMIYTTDDFFRQKAMAKQESLIKRIKVQGLNHYQRIAPTNSKPFHAFSPSDYNSMSGYTPNTTDDALRKTTKIVNSNKLSQTLHYKKAHIQGVSRPEAISASVLSNFFHY